VPQTPDDRCGATGKVRHRHRSSAAAACRQHGRAARWQGKRDPVLCPYRCDHCAGWHVGNADDAPGRRPRSARTRSGRPLPPDEPDEA